MSDAWRRLDSLPDLRHVSLLAVDSEEDDRRLQAGLGSGWPTGEGCVVGLSVAYYAEGAIRAHYFPIRHPDSNNFDSCRVFEWIADLIASGVRFVTQNGLYDWGWLHADADIGMPPSEQLEEIGAAAALIDENRASYSLDALCAWRGIPGKDETLLRATIETTFGVRCGVRKNKPQAYIARLPACVVGPYAEQDAVATLMLFDSLAPDLDKQGLRPAYRLEVDIMAIALEMRRRGIRVDLACAERNRDILLGKRDRALAALGDQLGRPVDMDDLNQTSWLAETCDRLRIKYPRTKTGQPSFSSNTGGDGTGWMKRVDHWFLRGVIEADKYNKAARDFLERHILGHAVKGRLHAEIWPHRSETNGTKSFRFSYSNPPLQQMPSHDEEIAALTRSPFLPEDGEFWASCDQSQQEFRILTHYAASLGLDGAREAAARYHNDPNTDFHALVAEITGLDRLVAKSVNFAKAYGAGISKFANTIGKPEDEARLIYARYDRELPFVPLLAKHCQGLAERQGWLELYDKARRHFEQWEAAFVPWTAAAGPCGLEEARARRRDPSHPWYGQKLRRAGAYAAMNALVQGTAARQTKLWMRACWREGLVPLLQMHDGLEFSLPSPAPVERIAQLGCEVVSLKVPMKVDVAFGRNWADAAHAHWDDVPESVPVVEPVVYRPPTARFTIDPEAFERAILWAIGREAIRQGVTPPVPEPLATILRTQRFCNLHRKHDRTSIWVMANIIEPCRDDPDLFLKVSLARFTNEVAALMEIDWLKPFDLEYLYGALKARQDRGKTVFRTSAYKYPMPPEIKGMEALDCLFKVVLAPMAHARETLRPRVGDTLRSFSDRLQGCHGVGSFLTGQVVADMKSIEPLLSASDHATFIASGPGSERGFNRLLGRPLNRPWQD
jgi:DNA polymerase I-like protein with 3'-5' exonuclease and polymerase domains